MRGKEFEQLVRSVKQAGKIRRWKLRPARVSRFRPADIRSIRLKLKKSQSEFALMIGVSVSTLQNWEQGRRTADGAVLAWALSS